MRKAAGTQIKVRAGQVWEPSPGYTRAVESVDDVDVYWIGNSYTPLSELNENFTFVPQNDLERMAVDTPQWEWGDHCYYRHRGMVTKENHTKIFNHEWQNMRYYLGLDKKPHCRVIDGKWARQ